MTAKASCNGLQVRWSEFAELWMQEIMPQEPPSVRCAFVDILQERLVDRTGEQMVDFVEPQAAKEILEGIMGSKRAFLSARESR